MSEVAKYQVNDWNIDLKDDTFKIIKINNYEKGYMFALQVRAPAIDNSGIGHIIEHIIVHRIMELTSTKIRFGNDTLVSGVTCPNYVIFYIYSINYESFIVLLKTFFEVYYSLEKTEHIFTWTINEFKDSSSLISELIRREKDRKSVIWQNFYKKRFANTDYQFNSGGHTSEIRSINFNKVCRFWECNKRNVSIVVFTHENDSNLDYLINQFKIKINSTYQDNVFFDSKIVQPIEAIKYVSEFKNSFSYGIGLVNNCYFKNDDNILESLLYNIIAKDKTLPFSFDCMYDNTAPYGMIYFGIQLKKAEHDIAFDFFYDVILNRVKLSSKSEIMTISTKILDRLDLLNITEYQRKLEIIARIFQRIRRNKNLDNTLVESKYFRDITASKWKEKIILLLQLFIKDNNNHEILFCHN